jgi:hypothetical protein
MELHFICKHGERHVRVGENIFETGNWVLKDNTADGAIGGLIYLHEKQAEAAWHGGTIINWRVSDEEPDRKIFTYRVDGPFRVKCLHGWGREKAIVR